MFTLVESRKDLPTPAVSPVAIVVLRVIARAVEARPRESHARGLHVTVMRTGHAVIRH